MIQDHGVAFGDPAHLYVQPGGDDFDKRVSVAVDILHRRPVNSGGHRVTIPRVPNFLAVYSSEPDTVIHQEGTNGPDLRPLIEEHDRALGRLVQATRDVGIYKRTAFILTADHGMTDWTRTALPAVTQAIAGAGFSSQVVYVGQSPGPDAQVVIAPAGRVAHLFLRGAAATDQGRAAIRSALDARPELERVLGPADLAALHASPKLGDLVLEARPPWSFAKADLPPGLVEGAHGSEDELDVPLVLAGAGVGTSPPAGPGLVDVAPTIAALLGAPCPAQAQGRPLAESLLGPAGCS
jgi:arylsulfatase A-like enzyme